MRLSSLSFAAVLLFSSIVFAQHHESGSTPSAPPPSPASAAPSSPSAAPAPSPAPSISTSAPSAAMSHTSTPAPASIPENRVAPNSGPADSHRSVSPTESRSAPTPTSPTHVPRTDPGRLVPDQKISGETKIVSAPRIGQNSSEKEPEMKPGPPQLRHRICDNGPCKEKEKEWKADPPRSDLRHRICPAWGCACTPGLPAGKGGCVANPPLAPPAAQSLEQCLPGEIWDGAVCTPSYNCAPGERWNGASCVASAEECASVDARASILVTELRALKAQIQDACGQNPPAQDCEDLKLRQREALQRYQMLLSEAGPRCQATLEAPGSLE